MENTTRGKMTAVIGAQYGSEGKGAIVRHVANDYQVHVRVGSPNAGHTIYWNGEKHVMQSIPCGWINPDATIVIGRGALLNMKQLMLELEHIEKYYPDFKKRFFIDAKAGVLDEKFHEQEGGIHGEMHRRIGSTGEGVGPARVARINRDPEQFRLFEDVAEEYGLAECKFTDTPRLIATMQDNGSNILLEGTQGSGLSLLHSHWPYCTSVDTNAAGILSEVGIAPSRLTNVLLVARTFPIRVAGTSGPMKNETTWEKISELVGHPVVERTTVTKKIRRVAFWDDEVFETACMLNAPTEIALTFADYVDPHIADVRGNVSSVEQLSEKLKTWVNVNSPILGAKLKYISTGTDSVVTINEMEAEYLGE
nr:MAG TPA: adenylosuccinate synthetase [Caudoviricetes sp.]